MTNQTQLPLEDQIRKAVQSVEPNREFSNDLWNQIASRARQPRPRSLFQKLFPTPAWSAATVLIAVALIVAVVGPQKVVEAVSSLFGYLPGVGFVQRGDGTLYLPEPVSMEQNGVTLIVDQAVSDGNSLVVSYHFSNLPEGKPDEGAPCFYDRNQIRLPDGKLRLPIGGGAHGSQAQVIFPALANGVDRFTLLASMDIPDERCTAPAEWAVDVTLVPMPLDMTLMPVFEGEEIEQPVVVEAKIETNAAEGSQSMFDVSFAMDRVAKMDDGYLVTGHVVWSDERLENIWVSPEDVAVTDAAGKSLTIEPTEEGTQDNNFAFKIKTLSFQQPLTIQIKSVYVVGALEESDGATFSFEAGADPQVGQSWELNQDLDVLGQKIHLRSARVVEEENSENTPTRAKGYAFELETSPQVNNIFFHCTSLAKPQSSWGEGRELEGGIKQVNYYSDELPTGKVEFQINQIHFRVDGTWQMQWQLPVE